MERKDDVKRDYSIHGILGGKLILLRHYLRFEIIPIDLNHSKHDDLCLKMSH